MSKKDKLLRKSIEWLAAEYFYFRELVEDIEELKKNITHWKQSESDKIPRVVLQHQRYFSRAELRTSTIVNRVLQETEDLVQKNPHLEKLIRDIRIANGKLIEEASRREGEVMHKIDNLRDAMKDKSLKKQKETVNALEQELHTVGEWIASLQLDLKELEYYKEDLQGIRHIIKFADITTAGFLLYFHAEGHLFLTDYNPDTYQYLRAMRNLKNPIGFFFEIRPIIGSCIDESEIMREKNGEADFMPIIYGRVRIQKNRKEKYHVEERQGILRRKVQVEKERTIYFEKEPKLGEIVKHSKYPNNDAYFICFTPPPYIRTPRQGHGCEIIAVGPYGWMVHVVRILSEHPAYYKKILETIVPPTENPNVYKHFIEKLDVDALIFLKDRGLYTLKEMKKYGKLAWIKK